MTDYTPGFQDYLNNLKEKNPKVDRDYTVADLAVLYTLRCLVNERTKQIAEDELAKYMALCCGIEAMTDETVWLEVTEG